MVMMGLLIYVLVVTWLFVHDDVPSGLIYRVMLLILDLMARSFLIDNVSRLIVESRILANGRLFIVTRFLLIDHMARFIVSVVRLFIDNTLMLFMNYLM